MRTFYKLLIFIGLSFIFGQSCQVKISSTESLSEKIFEALKAQDFEKLERVMPDEAKLTAFYQQYETKEERGIKFNMDEVPNLVAILKQSLQRAFEKILQDATEKGIDWQKTQFISYQETLEKDDFTEGATVVFTFQAGKEKLAILYKAIKIDGSWYLVEGLSTQNWVFKPENDLLLEEDTLFHNEVE